MRKYVVLLAVLTAFGAAFVSRSQTGPKPLPTQGIFTGFCTQLTFDSLNPSPSPITPSTETTCQPVSGSPFAIPIGSSGDLGNLTAVRDVSSTGSFILTVRVNGVVTLLSCTMLPGQTTCSDSTDRVPIASGDQVVVVGSPTASTFHLRVSFEKVD